MIDAMSLSAETGLNWVIRGDLPNMDAALQKQKVYQQVDVIELNSLILDEHKSHGDKHSKMGEGLTGNQGEPHPPNTAIAEEKF